MTADAGSKMAYLGLSFQQPQAEVSKGTRSKVMDLWDRKEMVLGSDSLLQAVFQGQISKASNSVSNK